MKNLNNVSEYGRWDDLIYTTEGTLAEVSAFNIIKHQLALDVQCKTPSLLPKCLPSINAYNSKTKKHGRTIANFLHPTDKI